MKVLARIPRRPSPGLRAGKLRREDLDAFGDLLEQLDGARVVLLVGDAGRQEMAIGLATAASAAGRRTALLESDLSRPSLAAALGLAGRPGLREYVRAEASAEQILQPMVLAGPASERASEPLVCVVAGEAPGEAELLQAERFRRAVAGLRSAYELTVIDGSPPLDERELRAVASQADKTLALGKRRAVPRRLRKHVDGLLLPSG